MTKIKIGWKWLDIRCEPRSCFTNGKSCVYEKGRTYRQFKDGGLAVFKTEEDARFFLTPITLKNYDWSKKLIKVTYRPCKHELFFTEDDEITYNRGIVIPPYGTDFANWVQY